jgi:MFS family permease
VTGREHPPGGEAASPGGAATGGASTGGASTGGFVADLRVVLRRADFRKLFAVRLTSQFGDGVLNVGLASYVFFNPERAAGAPAVAAAFAVLLLPYSLIGPFAGVLLDRWRRRNVLLGATLLRAGIVLGVAGLVLAGVTGPAFYATVLVAIGVNRFFLSGLGASLPHVVDDDELVMANAVSPTCGTIVALLGAGAGFVVRGALGAGSDAAVFVIAAGCYLTACALSLRMPADLLGPDDPAGMPGVRAASRNVVAGFVAGARHVAARRPAALALSVMAATRCVFGVLTVMLILLFRNDFNEAADVDAGLAGLAVAVGASGAGFATAALVTPIAVRRMRTETWVTTLLATAAVLVVVPSALFQPWALVVASFGLGVCVQGIKICVDALVQHSVDDAFRGRVFALYDMIFNVVFVLAAGVAAAALPPTGRSLAMLAALSAGLAATAIGYGRATTGRRTELPTPAER